MLQDPVLQLSPPNQTVTRRGAFTPTCTDLHLPGFIRAAPRFEKLGVGTLAVVTTNDRFIMSCWKDAMKACMEEEGLTSLDDKVTMIADKDGEIIKALGFLYNSKLNRKAEGTRAAWQMLNSGLRSKRFALVVQDGVVKARPTASEPLARDSLSSFWLPGAKLHGSTCTHPGHAPTQA